ncbi:MAG TPA: hypothetical protein VIC08_09980, partial [Cellvibrionaceae bacterium]
MLLTTIRTLIQRPCMDLLFVLALGALLAACGGSSGSDTPVTKHSSSSSPLLLITTQSTEGGVVSPTSHTINSGASVAFTLQPDVGYEVSEVSGCEGELDGDVYTTSVLAQACELSVIFSLVHYAIDIVVYDGGNAGADHLTVEHGDVAQINIWPEEGNRIADVSGCEGEVDGLVFTLLPVTDSCTLEIFFEPRPRIAGNFSLSLQPVPNRTFYFTWEKQEDKKEYRLLESADGESGFSVVAVLDVQSIDYELTVPLHLRTRARYQLEACDDWICEYSDIVEVGENINPAVERIAFYNPSDTCESIKKFRSEHALSADGQWMAYLTKNKHCENAEDFIVIYHYENGLWLYHSHIAYAPGEGYTSALTTGTRLTLSGDGSVLALGVVETREQAEGDEPERRVYIFNRENDRWALVKKINTPQTSKWRQSNLFSNNSLTFNNIKLSEDGSTLVYSAGFGTVAGAWPWVPDPYVMSEGRVYVHKRNDGEWTDAFVIKGPDTLYSHWFGQGIALSSDGNTLAVGAPFYNRGCSSSGRNVAWGSCEHVNYIDDPDEGTGAVYIFTYTDSWRFSEKIVKKASDSNNGFLAAGHISMNASGDTFIASNGFEDYVSWIYPSVNATFHHIHNSNKGWVVADVQDESTDDVYWG